MRVVSYLVPYKGRNVRSGPSNPFTFGWHLIIISSPVSVCRDVIVRAVTGSGKTLAFAVPIIHILSNRQVLFDPTLFNVHQYVCVSVCA